MFVAAVIAAFALASSAVQAAPSRAADPYANAFKEVSLSAPDGSIKVNFIHLGATATNVYVKDRHGKFRDVILGFDNRTLYLTNPVQPYFGPIVGRYANRIANSTFTIPPSKPINTNDKVYHVSANENNGTDTLHGGQIGYDRRVWDVIKQSSSSVTFQYSDPAGSEGFPGAVTVTATYTLSNDATYDIKLHATASEKTPIMLSSHTYWNLDAYETPDALNHKLWIDADRVIGTDGLLIPTGELINVQGTAWDFREARAIGARLNQTTNYCGAGCVGYDNAWVYTNPTSTKPKMALWSPESGIKLTATTDQKALQIYTCNGVAFALAPRKVDQGGPNVNYADHSCIVVEQEGYIDAINNPAWGQDQIYEPGKDYSFHSTYTFTTLK